MSARRTGIILDDMFCRHAPPAGHPERPDRIRAIAEAIEHWSEGDSLIRLTPVPLDAARLGSVHSAALVDSVKATRGRAHSSLDPDTHTSAESFEVALLAAGSALALTRRVLSGRLNSGFAAVRPPGHHAESGRAMGFCLFNNVALAAQDAIETGGARRVAIVDFDVHHGNGTQEIFYERDDVLYVSNHQYPFYPGTGAARERGSGSGEGFTLNLPMPAGVGDAFVLAAYHDLVLPALARFEPELILVSAGFDAHRLDPLGGLQISSAGFGLLAALLIHAADAHCGGRIGFVLEGGYSLEGLASSVVQMLEVCLDPPAEVELPAPPPEFGRYRALVSGE